jgi:hypothetical protein
LLGPDHGLIDVVPGLVKVGVVRQGLRLDHVVIQGGMGVGEAGCSQGREREAQRLAVLVEQAMPGNEPPHERRPGWGQPSAG